MTDAYTALQDKFCYGDLSEAYRDFYRITRDLAAGPWTMKFVINNIKCAVAAAEEGLRRREQED